MDRGSPRGIEYPRLRTRLTPVEAPGDSPTRSGSPRILAGLSLLLVCAPLTPATDAGGTPASLRTSRTVTMDLEAGLRTPPAEAKPRVYRWWLNSQVTEAAITRDLEEMAAKGIGGALLFDAGGGKDVPPGPP